MSTWSRGLCFPQPRTRTICDLISSYKFIFFKHLFLTKILAIWFTFEFNLNIIICFRGKMTKFNLECFSIRKLLLKPPRGLTEAVFSCYWFCGEEVAAWGRRSLGRWPYRGAAALPFHALDRTRTSCHQGTFHTEISVSVTDGISISSIQILILLFWNANLVFTLNFSFAKSRFVFAVLFIKYRLA